MNICEAIDLINEDAFIVSDPHMYHKNILEFEKCRAEEMLINGYSSHEEWITDNWNEAVGENDTVVCLGDFAFKKIEEASAGLNGNKIIILGNHDRGKQAYELQGWTVVDGLYSETNLGLMKLVGDDDHLLSGVSKNIMGKKTILCHYPLFSKDPYDTRNPKIRHRMELLEGLHKNDGCELNLHGHTHSRLTGIDGAINCCLENTGFRPIRIKEAILKGE